MYMYVHVVNMLPSVMGDPCIIPYGVKLSRKAVFEIFSQTCSAHVYMYMYMYIGARCYMSQHDE